MPKPYEIVLCNLHLRTVKKKGVKVKELILRDTIFSYEKNCKLLEYDKMDDRRLIHRLKLKEDLIIDKIEIISRHGFTHNRK